MSFFSKFFRPKNFVSSKIKKDQELSNDKQLLSKLMRPKQLFCQSTDNTKTDKVIDGKIEHNPLEKQKKIEVVEVPNQKPLSPPKTTYQDAENQKIKTVVLQKNSQKKNEKSKEIVYGQYFTYLEASGRSPGTILAYRIDLRWWKRQVGSLEGLLHKKIEKTLSGMGSSTARRKIASLRSYSKWRLREGEEKLYLELSKILSPKVADRVPKDKGEQAFRELTNQARRLCKEGDHKGIWIGLMNCCGLRISEIQSLQPLEGGKNILKIIGKGKKERLVPTPGWLKKAIEDKKESYEWRRDRKRIWFELNQIGITHPHSLRHTYASELIRKDYKLEEVQKLLGHKKLDTTLVYAKITLPSDVTQRLGMEETM